MKHQTLVIGIAGGSSSGKTTVTREIAEALGAASVALLQHDAYYKDLADFDGLPPDQINFDHPDAYDTQLFIHHVRQLKISQPVHQPVYSYTSYRRTGEIRIVEPRPIVMAEGILIFEDQTVRDLLDIKVYVDTDDDERIVRRIRRDVLERGRSVESVVTQYLRTVKPMHLEFVEPSKRWADIIIPRGGENKVAIDMVVAKLRTMLLSR